MQTKKEITEIIYYDCGEITAMSFYINGFLSNQKKYNYKLLIKRDKPYFLKQSSLMGEWYKFVLRLGIFEFKNGNNKFFFCMDRSDHSTNFKNEGYIIPVLEIVKYYFKANYNANAIDNDPNIKKFRDKIIPIGTSFPLYIESMIKFMPRIFPDKNINWTFKETKDRLNLMFRNPRLSYLKHLRKTETDLNIFFVMPYYPTQKILNEFRFEVMKALKNLIKTNAIIGFAPTQKLPEKHQYFEQPVYEMRSYFRHLARSKVAIYVRGPHDGISSKLGQLLAMGKPIIGQTIHNNKELYYQNPFFNEQFAYDEPEEIAKHVHELLQQPEKAASFAEANANTFDTKFSPEITVSKIIEKLFD
jgi:hypothetical protein